jgi:hypothetical protein
LDVARAAVGRQVSLIALSGPRLGNLYEFVALHIITRLFNCNRAFKNYVEKTLDVSRRWRVVNGADIVPHVPPKAFGFEHIGNEAWLSTKSKQYVFCNDGESKQCSGMRINITPYCLCFSHS